MKKSFLLIISLTLFLTTNAQINEHSDRRTSITIGSFNPIIQKPQLQFEHLLGSKGSQHWSIGENLQYHLVLINLKNLDQSSSSYSTLSVLYLNLFQLFYQF